MRLLWPLLATFAITVFSPRAHADRIAPCACPQRVVLPARGATNVPLNTKVWILDHTGAVTREGLVPTFGTIPGVEPGAPLAPSTEYSPDGTRFTTGSDVDTTPPTAPTSINVSIVVMAQPSEMMAIDAITLWGDYDADTALIKVDIDDGRKTSTLYTTPRRMYLCLPGVAIAPGKVNVSVRALDLAGNESPPFTATVDAAVTTGPSSDDCGEGPRQYTGRHFRCGTGDMAILFLIPIVALGLLTGLAIVRLLRNAKIRRTPPLDVGLLVAEAVVRMMMRGHLVASAIGLVAMGVAFTFDARSLGAVLGLIPLVGLSHWGTCRIALRRLARIDASAERRDTWLIVRDRSGESRIRSNERVFRGAVRAVLPAASVEKD